MVLRISQAVEKRGVGAMELVAMDMKLRGMYIARQLSFHGVSFRIEDIPVPKEAVKTYNKAVKLVLLMSFYSKKLSSCGQCRESRRGLAPGVKCKKMVLIRIEY